MLNTVDMPNVEQVERLRIHAPTGRALAGIIRMIMREPFGGPSWQERSFKEGMRTAAEIVDQIVAEAERGRRSP